MTEEKSTKRLPVALDVLLVCTVSISLLGALLLFFMNDDYLVAHVRPHEMLTDLYRVLAMGAIVGTHFGLVYYSRRYVPDALRMPRRVFVFLQVIAVLPVCAITDDFSIWPALYISGCSALCYVVIRVFASRFPTQANVLFAYIVLLLAIVGFVAKVASLFMP